MYKHIELNLKELKESQYFRLIRYPSLFWFFSLLFLLLAIYLTYIIVTEHMYDNQSNIICKI
jgi:hypothetical protein